MLKAILRNKKPTSANLTSFTFKTKFHRLSSLYPEQQTLSGKASAFIVLPEERRVETNPPLEFKGRFV